MADLKFLGLAVLIAALAALPCVNAANPANMTAEALQPVNNSNFSAGSTIGLWVNCSAATQVLNATVYLYYENGTAYSTPILRNTSTITTNTSFNISFASPNFEYNYTWFVSCDNATVNANSSNLTFRLQTTHFLTSTLSTPLDGSTQTMASVISLIGSCQSNATLTGGRFWVYRSNTGADYGSYPNTSAITNDTMFSASFTVPIEAASWAWNLQCFDNYGQTANLTSNFSFDTVSGASSGTSSTGCTSNSGCSSGHYCSNGACVDCDYSADGICRTCAAELGLVDPDCAAATPIAAPTATAAPTAEPTATATPTATPTEIASTQPPEPSPTVEAGVTYGEATAEIETAQEMLGGNQNADAESLIALAMSALENSDYAQAKAYAVQAQALLLAPTATVAAAQSAGFDWTIPAILIAAILLAGGYYAWKKKGKYY